MSIRVQVSTLLAQQRGGFTALPPTCPPCQVVFLPSGPGGNGPTRGKDANMGLPAQMMARDDPTAEAPVEKQVCVVVLLFGGP